MLSGGRRGHPGGPGGPGKPRGPRGPSAPGGRAGVVERATYLFEKSFDKLKLRFKSGHMGLLCNDTGSFQVSGRQWL